MNRLTNSGILKLEARVDSLGALDEVLHKKDLKQVNGISAMGTFVVMASNTKVKPLPGRAQGTFASFTPQLLQ